MARSTKVTFYVSRIPLTGLEIDNVTKEVEGFLKSETKAGGTLELVSTTKTGPSLRAKYRLTDTLMDFRRLSRFVESVSSSIYSSSGVVLNPLYVSQWMVEDDGGRGNDTKPSQTTVASVKKKKKKKKQTKNTESNASKYEYEADTTAMDDMAKKLSFSFHAYLNSHPEVLASVTNRASLSKVFHEYVKETQTRYNGTSKNSTKKRSQLEAKTIMQMKQQSLLLVRLRRDKRKTIRMYYVAGKKGRGDFTPEVKRKSKTVMESRAHQKTLDEANKQGVTISTTPTEEAVKTNSKFGKSKLTFEITYSNVDLPKGTKTSLASVSLQGRHGCFRLLTKSKKNLQLGNSSDPILITILFDAPQRVGMWHNVLVAQFQSNLGGKSQSFYIARTMTVRCGDARMHEILKPTSPYVPKKRNKYEKKPQKLVEAPEKEQTKTPKQVGANSKSSDSTNPFRDLPHARIPNDVRDLIINSEMENLLLRPDTAEDETYSAFWKNLLWASELQAYEDIKLFDMEHTTLQRRGHYFALNVPGLAEGRPSVLRGDLVKISWNDSLYHGRVVETQLLDVIMEFDRSFGQRFNPSLDRVDVRFTFSRTQFRTCHAGCQLAQKHLGNAVLFPTEEHLLSATAGARDNVGALSSIKWSNRHLNEEQREAIFNILKGMCRPLPYLLFGPPGTGKSTCVVEAVNQLMKHKSQLKLLVMAPSNDAADLLVEKLSQYFPPSEMHRILAYSRPLRTVADSVKPYCKEGQESHQIYQEIMSMRLVVCTVSMASRLSCHGIKRGHFDVMIVDEAGQATEPDVVAAAATLLDFKSKESSQVGQLVLAGDPQQLGPVITSNLCTQFGLNVSLMERLISEEVYKRQGDNNDDDLGKYPPGLITKLVKNYRSHKAILDLPNRMYYDGELQVSGDPFQTNAMCNWEHLPTSAKNFPVVFHAVCGENMREGSSPSWFNLQEVEVVVNYVEKMVNQTRPPIAANDIGVITPYARQAQKISQALSFKNIRDVKVGSVETFQGQERRCIIVSTVRADEELLGFDLKYNLGFVSNPKRFNVTITRAQSLVVVVGQPNVLARDRDNWLPFLKYCKENDGWFGHDWVEPREDEETQSGWDILPPCSSDGFELVDDDEEETTTAKVSQEGIGFINREE